MRGRGGVRTPRRRPGGGRPGVAWALALGLLSLAAAPPGWEWTAERKGVRIWSRPTEGTEVREVLGRAEFDLSPERFFRFLADVESYPDLLPPTTQARLLRRDGDESWYYMVIDPAWVAPRDYCIRTRLHRLSDGRLKSTWENDESACPPPPDGTVRIHINEGYWLLTPLPGGRTEVTYQAITDPGGMVPKWMVNKGQIGALVDIFQALGEAAALDRYAAPEADAGTAP